MHHGWRDGGGRASQGHSGGRIDDRDNLAGPGGRWLLEVHLSGVTSNTRVDVGVGGSRRQGDGRSDLLLDRLDLVLEGRGVGRAARQRRAIGRGGVDGMQIVLGQETRAKLQIVIQIKRPPSFESGPEGRHCGSLSQFSHALDSAELALLGVLGGHLGSSPRAASVVVILHVSDVRVLVLLAVEEGRHIEDA